MRILILGKEDLTQKNRVSFLMKLQLSGERIVRVQSRFQLLLLIQQDKVCWKTKLLITVLL